MNKSELITAAAARADLPRKDAELLLNAALDIITAALSQEEAVQLSGFGTFEMKDRAARVGRNPHTGEAVPIPAAKVPVFNPSKIMKDKILK